MAESMEWIMETMIYDHKIAAQTWSSWIFAVLNNFARNLVKMSFVIKIFIPLDRASKMQSNVTKNASLALTHKKFERRKLSWIFIFLVFGLIRIFL